MLNPTKCTYLRVFPGNHQDFEYSIGDTKIKREREQRDLGVLIDENLSFHSHINKVINTCNSQIYMIRRNFKFTNNNIQIKLFKALVLPILTYCISVWWPKEIGLSLKLALFKLNPIVFMQYVADLTNLFKVLRDCYKFFVFFEDKIVFSLSSHLRRSHRVNHELSILPINSNLFNFWLERTIPRWNMLEKETVTSRSVKSFKKRLLSIDFEKIKAMCDNILMRMA